MKNNVFKKLIASILSMGILMSSVGVFAAEDVEANVTVDKGNKSTVAVDTVENDLESDVETDVETTESSSERSTKSNEKNTSKSSSGSTVKSTKTSDKTDDDGLSIAYPTETVQKKISDNRDAPSVTWSGSGSEENPYAVSDVAHFLDMTRLINETTSGLKYFELTSDINLSGVDIDDIDAASTRGLANTIVSINPSLSDNENVFFVLDGNNRHIRNFSITNESRNSIGIFGYLNSSSVVKNVIFSDISITSTYSSAYALGIFLKNEGTISDCGFERISISTSSVNTDDAFVPISGSTFRIYAGVACAIVDNEGTFTQEDFLSSSLLNGSTTDFSVTSSSSRSYIGGVVAQNRGYVYKTKATNVTVTAPESATYVGGYIAANLTSSSSSSTGMYYVDVELSTDGVKGGNFTGALCGNNTGRISSCTAKGNNNLKDAVSSSNYDLFMFGGKTYGGIAASNTGLILKCAALNIGAYYSNSVEEGIYGGIAGTNTYNVSYCVSTGVVVSSDPTIDIYAGGIIGVGSTVRNFYVGNCFTLVKLPSTTADLGCVIGIDGDTPYNNSKVQSCFYSSVVALRPSPVSYGGTGADYGDLQYSKSYLAMKTNAAQTVGINAFDDFSGWTDVGFSIVQSRSSFAIDSTETAYVSINNDTSNNQVIFTPNGINNVVQTVYYDTDITLPQNIGPVNSNETYVLSSQPLSLKIMFKNANWVGEGTANSPYEIAGTYLPFMSKVPYGNFKLTASSSYINLTTTNLPESFTFWGTLDGNGKTLTTNNNTGAVVPLFKGIYGSRSSNPQLDTSNHTSNPNPSSDSADNLKYGVVKNLSFEYGKAFTSATAIFGNLCNATVTDVTFTALPAGTLFTPAEENTGVVFKTVYGNSYIYNVYNDSINVTINGLGRSNLSGFIGVVDATNAVIDNCGSRSVLDSKVSSADYCSVFIGNIKSLTGAIQNCYSAGGITYSASGSLGNNNYLFAARSVSSAHLYNCYYSPTHYYSSSGNKGVSKPIPDGSYTGTLSLWGFANSMYIIGLDSSDILNTKAVNNINRFDNATYASTYSTQLTISSYFTATMSGTGYTCNNVIYTNVVSTSVVVSATADDNSDIRLMHNATGLVARATIASSSDIEMLNGVYLIQKPTDLYLICRDQASTATDNGRYLSSEFRFKLVADIDMTGLEIDSWGRGLDYPFRGEITGDTNADGTPKYTISGLNLSSQYSKGLFGYVDGATIQGIGISDSTVTGGTYTGMLVGQIVSRATISNCKVSSSTVNGNARVGGLIGGVSGSESASSATVISQCFLDSTTVTANTTQNSGYNIENPSIVGGIIGSVGANGVNNETKYAQITGCQVTNSEISGNNYHVGGIVGMAACKDNVLSGCTVSGSTISSEYTSYATASVGGIVGTFGGIDKTVNNDVVLALDHNTLTSSTVSGENASGIVSRIVNFNVNGSSYASTVSYCEVEDSDIIGVKYAGGITAYVGSFSGLTPDADKNIFECIIDSDTNVKAKVAGGIVGVVMTAYTGKTLAIDSSYSYSTVTTTGDKGSKTEGAGGIIGRLASSLDTSNISVSNCISGGKSVGSACLGGIIALLNSNEHTSNTPIISDCYITATLTQKSIRAIKGLIIGYISDDPNSSNNHSSAKIKKVVSGVVFSSYGASYSPYGNLTEEASNNAPKYTYTDVNLGSDGESGVKVKGVSNTVVNNYVVSGNDSNNIALTPNTPNSARFNTTNLPTVPSSFAIQNANSSNSNLCWESSNTTKLNVGTTTATNSSTVVRLLTASYKGKVNVFTYFGGTVGTRNETVRFQIGFTVICTGTHKFDGAGEPSRPYKIYDAEDLVAIKEHHDTPLSDENGDYFYTASYVLMNDIDLSTICYENGEAKYSFPSIGDEEHPFKGTITSNGSNTYTIRNLYIGSPSSSDHEYAGNTAEHTSYSDCFGVFGYMEDAALSNINFENALITSGKSSGVVAGNVKNTEISNVSISGEVSIDECGDGGILVGTSMGALSANDITIDGASVSAQGSAGGIVGVASQCEGSTITNFHVKNCSITSSMTSGPYYAGAVAAQMNGVVSGNYEDGELVSPSIVENCTVSAVICGGVVGSGSPNAGNNSYGLTICGVDVITNQQPNTTPTYVHSPVENNNASESTAGGILGKTQDSYDYVIKDCNVGTNVSVEAYYVAGGILGSANISASLYDSSLSIYNCTTKATLTQNVENVSTIYGGVRKTVGVGGAIGLISQSASLRESGDDSAMIKVYECSLGGDYHGSMNVGGAFGQISTQSYYSYLITQPLLSNCILTNTITKTSEENGHNRFGLVVGAIEGNVSGTSTNPYPDRADYVCDPFINIFYSSAVSSGFEFFGDSEFYNYQNYIFDDFIYDLNNISFTYEDYSMAANDPARYVELPIAMQESYVDPNDPNASVPKPDIILNTTKFHFNEDITTQLGNKLTGDIISGFTVAGETLTDFTVNDTEFTVSSIESGDESLFRINANTNSILFTGTFGQTDLIFTYTNGIRISIPVVCGVSVEGNGNPDSPYIIDSAVKFAYIVPTMPGSYFKQTADIDFSSGPYRVTRVINNFTGHYDGMDDNGVIHKLTGIEFNVGNETDGGIFGVVSGTITYNDQTLPNIENLIIEEAEITATGCTNVGIVAGKLTGGASISNVTVTGSTLQTGTAPIGGIVGTIDGASSVDGCTVSGTTLTASSGCVGGIAGVMNNGSGQINSCLVSNTSITSGTTSAADIAGGIVAQAVGTVNGRTQTLNAGLQDEEIVLLDSVVDCSLSAYYTGGAVGANFYSNATSDLTINNVKVSSSGTVSGGVAAHTTVASTYSGSTYTAPSAGGILAAATGQNDHQANITINNCYVGKNTVVSSQRNASGCFGTNITDNIAAVDIIDTQAYANVSATQRDGGLIVYAGGLIANASIDPNDITIDGSVAGGNVTATGWYSYAGGAIGYLSKNNVSVTDELFVNGVLSAIVSSSYGTDTAHQNPVNCYGKFLGGMADANLFTDNTNFKTVVFHDNYYSSYPQDINFFGNNAVDSSFNNIIPQTVPFEDINTSQTFSIGTSSTGPWNSIAIAVKNQNNNFFIKFADGKTTLEYGDTTRGKNTSSVDVDGFTVVGTDSNNNDIFNFDGNVSANFDYVNNTMIYSFSINPSNYGAGSVGASYDCGLATALPILCVEITGTGTQADPFHITNAIQLYVVGYILDENKYFVQDNDIDLSNTYNQNSAIDERKINFNGGEGFSPIGSASSPFKGNYDGQGHKITGLYFNRINQDNVGLFGAVASTSASYPAVLKNIHVELLESDSQHTNGIIGRENVGGLVGSIYGTSSNAQIINCSVTRSTVVGTNNVGGLCGQVGARVSVTGSFTESDVYSSTSGSYAGGLVGNISAGVDSTTMSTVNKCFSSSNVYAVSSELNSTRGCAGGLVARITGGVSAISNCLFTGTTNSGHGVYEFKSSASNTSVTVSSVIDAGQDTSMVAGRFAPINYPCINSTSDTNLTNVYYDNALIKVADPATIESTMTNITAKKTSQFVGNSNLTGISTTNWSYSAEHYPCPIVDTTDAYSVAYASLLSMAMMTSEGEEAYDTDASLYGRGLVYPVQLPQNVSSTKVSYASSIFDSTDTVPYPNGYDPNLYGVVTEENNVTVNNKNTDLLFEDINDSQSANYGKTSVYRNIFRQDMNGTSVQNFRSGNCLANGELMYNLQMPVVYASFTKSGVTYYREIKIPLSFDSLHNTYCISTQRQLFALGLASYETAVSGSKFDNYYAYNNNYKLITDITISSGNTTVFNPIGINETNGYEGKFDGDGHTITNLSINVSDGSPAGMFSKLGTNASVIDLDLVDATVSGTSYVGALVGRVVGSNVNISNCNVSGTNGSVTATGCCLGGLIGSVDYASNTVYGCSARVSVSGAKHSIGGLIGQNYGRVDSCYATGNVSTNALSAINNDTDTVGIGGLIGLLGRGQVVNSFASGNVTVNNFYNIVTNDRTYGVGGFVGVAKKYVSLTGQDVETQGINCCFSNGNVVFNGDNSSDSNYGCIKPYSGKTAVVGVGGFSGVNSTSVTNCYSSAAVSSSFAELRNQADNATFVAGFGGVCGVALDIVQNVYSSGSVARPTITNFSRTLVTSFYGVGGTVGTRKGDTTVYVSNAFFDSVTNADPDMTSIGDENDVSSSRGSFTTDELTNGQRIDGFEPTVWGFAPSSYPYLMALLNSNVSPAVRVNSILSVLVIQPHDEDYSAHSGNGVTMAITVPTTFSYTDPSTLDTDVYQIAWSGSTLNGNQATPVRTRNTAEHIDLTATVVGYEQYGSKNYERLCAEMRGTYNQPYLIGSVTDYEHINMTADEQQAALLSSPELYGQWATPLGEQNQQVEGTVYYQLMSDIDVQSSTRTFTNLNNVQYTYGQETLDYEGFVLNGNSYAILNAHNASSSSTAYFPTLDSNSVITNIAFKNISLSAGANTALVGVNYGRLYDVIVNGTVAAGTGYTAGIAAVNNNIIDGCVADVTINGASSHVGGLVGQNNSGASIVNSGSAGTMNVTATAPSNIGAFVASNAGNVSVSFTMVDMACAGGGVASSVGAFIGANSGGVVQGCYTRSSISFTNNASSGSTVALLAGTLTGGTVRDCYTAGNLGYFSDSQHSIAFASVGNSANVSAIYVDKAMAGKTSYKSIKYAIITKNLVKNVDVDNSMATYFTFNTDEKHYPQITSILNAVNTSRFDENDNIVYLRVGEEGEETIIRNYDVIKAYASVANVTVKTANSQYIDSLIVDSNTHNVNSSITNDSTIGIDIDAAPAGVVNITQESIRTSQTVVGSAVISASKSVSLRSATFTPTLKIKVATVDTNNNPNFSGLRYGTAGSAYYINDFDSLQSLSYYGQDSELYFETNSNINCNNYNFEQIPVFRGKLNYNVSGASNYRVIYNLTLSQGGMINTVAPGAYIGKTGVLGTVVNTNDNNAAILASNVTGATIENVIVTGEVNGGNNSGLLAGSVSSSTIRGIITSGYIKGGNVVGGVVGSLDTSILEDALSTAYVTGTSGVGGIAGEVVNNSTVDDVIFGGSSTGCSVTSLKDASSAMTDYYVDYQLNISEYTTGTLKENSIMKSSQVLSTVFNNNITGFTAVSGRYIVPSAFAYTVTNNNYDSQLYLAVDLASRLVNIRAGAGMGTIGKYITIAFDDTITTNAHHNSNIQDLKVSVNATEVPYSQGAESDYLSINDDTTNHVIHISVAKYDQDVTSTAMRLSMGNDPVQGTLPATANLITNFCSSRHFRYITPGMVRTIQIDYTLTDSTTNSDLTNKNVGILFRSFSDALGTQVDTMNVFDRVGTQTENITSMLIASNSSSSNGFFIADMLPEGYAFTVTATDDSDNTLGVSRVAGQDGWFVSLEDAKNSIIHVDISITSSSVPWGVNDRHTTLGQPQSS